MLREGPGNVGLNGLVLAIIFKLCKMEISRSIFIFNNIVAPGNSYLITIYTHGKPAYLFLAKLQGRLCA